jgi:D-aminopeptidase
MSKKLLTYYALSLFFVSLAAQENVSLAAQEKGRVREFGIEPGILSPGNWNAITDVEGVKVGHKTLVIGDSVRTGVTVILPHAGNYAEN